MSLPIPKNPVNGPKGNPGSSSPSDQDPRARSGLPLSDDVSDLLNQKRTINTESGKDDGLSKCPKCGSSEIEYSKKSDSLTCLFCRHRWNKVSAVEAFDLNSEIKSLVGDHVTTGAGPIDQDFSDIVTIKCQGCGAEVVINTADNLQSRCHWCRQTLSINSQIPNGAVPDAILPFKISKEEAIKNITDFAGSRRFFALPKFKNEFKPENVIGVFMPYMVIDGNLRAELIGKGEIKTAQWTEREGTGDNKRTVTYYSADVYHVERKIKYTVDDLQLEAQKERLDLHDRKNTNNIINTILPFDTKNAVVYNANYLKGHTSEKRTMDIDDLKPFVADQFLSIARNESRATTKKFSERGIRWESEGVEVDGSRWVSMYLPVWLYSYYEEKKDIVHYIAVNGRNGETMGSVPIHYPKLFMVSLAVGVVNEIPGVALVWNRLFGVE